MNLAHLHRLLGPHGLYEHALYRDPRPEHGYCTDDNARAVVIAAAIDDPLGHEILDATRDFLEAGFLEVGWRNRMSPEGDWTDGPGPEDSHGRALWALGVLAASDRLPPTLEDKARVAANRPLSALRANVYALLGITTAVAAGSELFPRTLVQALVQRLPAPASGVWRWPEPRLTYDNARVPMAWIRAGAALEDESLLSQGIELLEWLVEIETRDAWFSFTPVGGRGPGERGPAFDQQPIEAWAMADACEAAAQTVGGESWREMARRAVAWFDGLNDVGVPLYDPSTGAGHDGLEPTGVNLNCGAESTLSALGAQLVEQRLGSRSERR